MSPKQPVPIHRPNVLFIIADQHRWDFVGHESDGRTHTPCLETLRRRGATFRCAYTTAPLCCPARAALASGRYGMNSGCFTNLHQLPAGTPSFIQQFRQAGYHTCAIGKTHMEIHAYDSDLTGPAHRAYMDSLGWSEIHETAGGNMFTTGIRCSYSDFLRRRGALDDVVGFYRQWHYFMDAGRPADHPFVTHPWTLPDDLQETHFLADRAIQWLRICDPRQPFLLHLGFPGPHSPTEPHPHFLSLYNETQETWPKDAPDIRPWTLAARTGYRAFITQIDHHVGRVLHCLKERGMQDNTIIVYVADHGELAGDHGLYDKTSFFEGSVRIPLIMAGPGIAAGRDSRALVELIDLGKTLCDLCQVEPHRLDQGHSLAALLAGRTATARSTIYAEMGCDRMIFDGRYKLLWGEPTDDRRSLGRLHLDRPVNVPPAPARLYDLQEDPEECRNLATPGQQADQVQPLLAKLLARINENIQTQPYLSRGTYRPLQVTDTPSAQGAPK